MFTEKHRQKLIEILDNAITGINRSKAKQPRFASFYDEDIAEIRSLQQIIRTWATEEPEKPKK